MSCFTYMACAIVLVILILYLYPITQQNIDNFQVDTQTDMSDYFVPQPKIINAQGELVSIVPDKNPEIQSINDEKVNPGFLLNKCSKACCMSQWPLPFKMPVEKEVCDGNDNFVTSNYFCNNANSDAGCLCMTKDQKNVIETRGHNN